MAGNDLSFGGPYQFGSQPGMTTKPGWLTELAYIYPELAALLENQPQVVHDLDRRMREGGIVE